MLSLTFEERFGGFFNYVNSLRLDHYEQYMQQHPTTRRAALDSQLVPR